MHFLPPIHIINDRKVNFRISYKVGLFITKKINEILFLKVKLDQYEPEWSLSMAIAFFEEIEVLTINRPGKSKKEKILYYTVLFPFEEMRKSENQLKTYISFFFDALVMILGKKFNVKEEDIRLLQKEIEKEVIGNEAYKFNNDK